MTPPPGRETPAGRKDLHLAELLDFRPDQGVIRLHDQRVVILSAAAMGLLRKELIDTLGVEAVSSTPDEFRAFIAAEVAKWTQAVQQSGAKID